eukprot:2451202-Prymnesium_polylepis.1
MRWAQRTERTPRWSWCASSSASSAMISSVIQPSSMPPPSLSSSVALFVISRIRLRGPSPSTTRLRDERSTTPGVAHVDGRSSSSVSSSG